MLDAMMVDKVIRTKSTGRHVERALTAREVSNKKEPGFYADGQGLYLKIEGSGARRWVQRIVINGKRRDLGLGSASLVRLAEAREVALENRRIARAGGDPTAAKKSAAAVPTFDMAVERVIELNEPSWRSLKHAAQWRSTMKEYASPIFGSTRVSEISGGDVLKAVGAIWTVKPETARRVQQRIGTVFKWAIAHGYRTDNPATVAATTLPKNDRSRKKHHRALPYDQVRDAIATVQASKASLTTKLAFEFLVLTATRSAETRGASWTEIDLDKGVWVIPRDRMKTGREHRVPLSDPAAAVLEKAKALRVEGCDLLFPAKNICKPLSDVTLSKLVKELGIAAVPHGFRSSFRDWAAEQTAYPPQVCEFALAHVISDKAEAAYFRSDLFEKRRLMMIEWADYICAARSALI